MDEKEIDYAKLAEEYWTIENIVFMLNLWQKKGLLKITGVSPLQISLRKKLEREIEVDLNWIETWSKLWHGLYSGIKPRGYYLAQPVSQNLSRMTEFIKEHPQFTKEIILQATINYLNSKKLANYEFCKKSNKFINDQTSSELFSWCLQVVSGESEIKGTREKSL